MNDTCSGCRDAEGFTYMEQQLVINLDSIGHPYYRWVHRCRKESTCERFKKVKEFKMEEEKKDKEETNGSRMAYISFEEVKEILKKSMDETSNINEALEKTVQFIYLKGYEDAIT